MSRLVAGLLVGLGLVGCSQGSPRAASYCEAVEQMHTTWDDFVADSSVNKDLHDRYVAAAKGAQQLAPDELAGEWEIAVSAIEGSLVEGDDAPPPIPGRASAFTTLNGDATDRCGTPVVET